MYYSKTFIAGQFSPDYWEVKLYDVLKVGNTGKAFLFDPIPAVANMSSAVHIDIMDIDETYLSKSHLQSYLVSILSHDQTIYESSLTGTSLGILDTKSIVWQSDDLYSTKKLSSFSTSLTDIYTRYESSMLSVVTGNSRDIASSYAGKGITSTDPAYVTCDISLSHTLDTFLQEIATEAKLKADQHEVVGNFTYQMPDSSVSICADPHEVVGNFTYQMPYSSSSIYADQHEVLDFVDNVSNFKHITVSLEESPFTV